MLKMMCYGLTHRQVLGFIETMKEREEKSFVFIVRTFYSILLVCCLFKNKAKRWPLDNNSHSYTPFMDSVVSTGRGVNCYQDSKFTTVKIVNSVVILRDKNES